MKRAQEPSILQQILRNRKSKPYGAFLNAVVGQVDDVAVQVHRMLNDGATVETRTVRRGKKTHDVQWIEYQGEHYYQVFLESTHTRTHTHAHIQTHTERHTDTYIHVYTRCTHTCANARCVVLVWRSVRKYLPVGSNMPPPLPTLVYISQRWLWRRVRVIFAWCAPDHECVFKTWRVLWHKVRESVVHHDETFNKRTYHISISMFHMSCVTLGASVFCEKETYSAEQVHILSNLPAEKQKFVR